MAAYATLKLEFSPDPLSNASPSWVDITRYCRSADWFGGKQKDLDDPQAGGASFVLRNDDRRFEPEYAAGAYYPNIVPMRRFRATLISGGVSYPQGVYYAIDWGVAYPARTGYSETTVTCVDGFGVQSLQVLPLLDPPSAQSYADMVLADSPFAYYTLGDVNTSKMSAAAGTDGTYRSVVVGNQSLVTGDVDTSAVFQSGTSYGRVPLSDGAQFSNGDAFTVECVTGTGIGSGSGAVFMGGPWNTTQGDMTFYLYENGIAVYTRSGGVVTSQGTNYGTGFLAGTHHVAGVWTGNAMILYVDGAETNRFACGGDLIAGDSGDYLYVGSNAGAHLSNIAGSNLQHAAFYDGALSPARIKAHAAAVTEGYAAQSAGTRIAALATNALWSTAGITSSQFTVIPRFQYGQSVLDEIILTVQSETPAGLYWFNDAGNPSYQGWNQDTGVIQCTFGDGNGETDYADFTLAYDDELYNAVSVTRDGGFAQQHSDATSQGQYLPRSPESLSGLILQSDLDANAVSVEILARFKDPRYRVVTLSANGAHADSRLQILSRDIGDWVRVRKRGLSGAPLDVVTKIIGKAKSFDPDGNLTCTWNLSRGFNAADASWRLAIVGYSELGQTTTLG